MRLSDYITSPIERVLFHTIDPITTLDGHPVPALTTLLHLCGDDPDRFVEATRLVALFIEEAIKA